MDAVPNAFHRFARAQDAKFPLRAGDQQGSCKSPGLRCSPSPIGNLVACGLKEKFECRRKLGPGGDDGRGHNSSSSSISEGIDSNSTLRLTTSMPMLIHLPSELKVWIASTRSMSFNPALSISSAMA